MNIQKWFEGEIVDVDDPEKLGRVKVRETLGHSNRVSPEDLFWSHVLMPPTGANAKGAGVSPVGLTEDSKVIGFKINETLSYVIGSVAYVPNDADHSVSRQARGVGPVKKYYIKELGEKETEYDAKYPHNKTVTTSSGHVLELDDYDLIEKDYCFGTVMLCYAEIGKTLYDLSKDNDHYIGDDAFQPCHHYTADFVVQFHDSTPVNTQELERNMWKYYDQHQSWFEQKGFHRAHPLLRYGHFPVADLVSKLPRNEILNLLQPRQYTRRVWFSI
jgi:hypothetical protein